MWGSLISYAWLVEGRERFVYLCTQIPMYADTVCRIGERTLCADARVRGYRVPIR